MDDYTFNRWMTDLPGIDSMKLNELILPGAHNAGADKKATYVAPGVSHWAVCQNNSFYEQLNNGARALDVRVEYNVDSRGVGTFWFQHNGFRSSRSLENLVTQVSRFLQENPDEFVLLDFHELKSANTPFDHKEFNRFLLTHLGQRIIPSRNKYLSLGQLKQASLTQRVWVAAGHHPDLDQDWLLSEIQHEWSGQSLTSVKEVQALIARATQDPPSPWRPWSLSATSYTALGGPVDIKEHLDRWFAPASEGWILKCSIINADFFEESKLVPNCRIANIMKARTLNK